MRPRRPSADLGLAIGGAILAVVLVAALVSLAWTPYPVEALSIADRLAPPGGDHLLGTDQFGRDVASMLMAGARLSLAVAFVAVVIGVGVGVPLGLLAAAGNRFLDGLVMRATDIAFAFPAVVVAVVITALFGPGAMNAVIAIGIFNVPVFARLARGAGRSLLARDFVRAARLAGKSDVRIAAEHLLPNIAGLVVVQASTQFALGVLAEAGLSYVGLGAQPPAASWGRMLNEAQTLVAIAPWLVVLPGLAIMLTVLGFSLVGDGLRDRLEPRAAAAGPG